MTALLPAPARTIVYGSSVAPYLQWPVAQPSDTLDYGLDMSSVVTPETDTIIQVVASVQPSGSGELTITQLYVIGNVVVIWLSGGVATRTYQIQLDITTVNARSYSLVAYLPVSSELAVPPVPLPPVAGFGTTTTICSTHFLAVWNNHCSGRRRAARSTGLPTSGRADQYTRHQCSLLSNERQSR